MRANVAAGDARVRSNQAEAGGRPSQPDERPQHHDYLDDNGNHAEDSEPYVIVQADDFVNDCRPQVRQWYHRAIQCANANAQLRMPDGVSSPKYCNPFAGFTSKAVAQWTIDHSAILKEQQDEVDWTIRLLPQEEMLQDSRDYVMASWERFVDGALGSPCWTREKCESVYNYALEVFHELGELVLPREVEPDGRRNEELRLSREVIQTAEPIIAEQWRRYIEYCTNVIDAQEDLNARRARQTDAIQAAHNGVKWTSPPSSEQWPSVNFGGKRSGIEGHWVPIGELGQGGNGSATQWAKFDDNMDIVDRVVIKDARFTASSDGFWFGTGSERMIREAYVMKRLSSVSNTDVFINYRGCAVVGRGLGWNGDAYRDIYRVYQEYARCGDMHDMVCWYLEHAKKTSGRLTASGTAIPRV